MHLRRNAAFTLIELSIVILVLSLLAAAAFRYATNATVIANTATLNQTLDVVETALQNYRNVFGRLPCPSDITLAENSAAFGVEVGTSGDGNCTGYNFINSGADPDSADPDYIANTNNVVAGGIPTKTLKIDDKYAYDAWGKKIMYAVDKRITATSAFTTYTITNTTIGAIVVKKNYNDLLAYATTYKGIYALISFGANGHGAYQRSTIAANSTRFNNASSNSNELKNCHCDSSAVATTFDRIFVQTSQTGTTTIANKFDDTVRVKTRMQMISYAEMQ